EERVHLTIAFRRGASSFPLSHQHKCERVDGHRRIARLAYLQPSRGAGSENSARHEAVLDFSASLSAAEPSANSARLSQRRCDSGCWTDGMQALRFAHAAVPASADVGERRILVVDPE